MTTIVAFIHFFLQFVDDGRTSDQRNHVSLANRKNAKFVCSFQSAFLPDGKIKRKEITL